jgi:hypothetical protein
MNISTEGQTRPGQPAELDPEARLQSSAEWESEQLGAVDATDVRDYQV